MRKSKGSQKIREYELTGARKCHEYEMTGAQKKIDAYRLMDSQKTRESNLSGAQKTDEDSSCVKVRKNDGVEIIHECQRKRACRDVDVKSVVQDPMDDDRVLVESGTEMTPVPREPSEFEKQKHNLTHIPFQPWCTSCVKGKAQAEPHKRTERIIEDSELPVIQCDYLMLKDTAGHIPTISASATESKRHRTRSASVSSRRRENKLTGQEPRKVSAVIVAHRHRRN